MTDNEQPQRWIPDFAGSYWMPIDTATYEAIGAIAKQHERSLPGEARTALRQHVADNSELLVKTRARESRLSYDEVTENAQGKRNPRHLDVKNLREQLVVELRASGVEQKVIAEVLNVSQPRISQIELAHKEGTT